ncbi:DUF6631 family protein [Halomonas alimentaria]|uniref:Uncharacterized protein n=1 Tax=Halomonas alimentaria TaxID=147248 RepID=A0A7X5APN0_9GAMM|nr:DUF6631 family protein [Halomonas alimentaria]NAW33246.1 hypothetical protein [Halomonas alimentaria]
MSEHQTPAADEAASDIEILLPDEAVTIEGEEILVREFRYLEGLRAIALARPLFAELARILEEGEIDALALDGLIAEHHEAWIQLMAISTGKDESWIEGLRDRDGQTLSMTFWRVNSGFFMRRLVFGGALARAMRQMVAPTTGNPSPSPSSSTPSSVAATDATPESSPGG